MDIFNLFWPDFICAALAVVFLNAALTGRFYTHGKGGRKLVASTKSLTARLGFLIVAALLVVWTVWDLKRKFLHG